MNSLEIGVGQVVQSGLESSGGHLAGGFEGKNLGIYRHGGRRKVTIIARELKFDSR